MCPHCGVVINRRNVKLHIQRKHAPTAMDITSTKHLKAQCLDHNNGIFAVIKSFSGPNTALHVQKKTWGTNRSTGCELDVCKVNAEFAARSNCKHFECPHIQSLQYCPPARDDDPSLEGDVLQEMVRQKWFGKEKQDQCLKRQREAIVAGTPLSCQLTICTPPTKKYISVFEPTVSYYSRLGRVIVTYDSKQLSWHCPCAKPRQSCLHKNIAKWHLFQVEPNSFRKTRSMEEEGSQFPCEVEGMDEEVNPPEGRAVERMVRYIYHSKKMPPVLTNDVIITDNFPKTFTPAEIYCTECMTPTLLGEPELITIKGKIVTVTDVIEGL